jgi:hypothetical protein
MYLIMGMDDGIEFQYARDEDGEGEGDGDGDWHSGVERWC